MTHAVTARPTAALAETLGRCAEIEIEHLGVGLRLGRPAEPGWLTRADALEPDVLEDLLARVGRGAGSGKRSVQGTWLLEAYAGALVVPAVLGALTEGRVPDVDSGNTAVRLDDEGEATGVAFARPLGAVLAGDEAAGDPLVAVVADRAALWGWFRRRLVGHLEPLVEALRPVTRRGHRALWASVEDTCSGYLDWLGESLGRGPEARAQAGLLLGVEPPLRGPAVFTEIAWSGGVEIVRERNGCCLSYARGGRDGRACFTCPRTTPEERLERLEARA